MQEKIYVMWENVNTAIITTDYAEEQAEVLNLSNEQFKLPFGFRTVITQTELEDFLLYRCFPKNRANARQVLKASGISFYNIRDLLAKTHGVKNEDKMWLSFGAYPAGDYKQLRQRDTYNLYDPADKGYKRSIAIKNDAGIDYLRISPEFCMYNELLTNGNQRKFKYDNSWYKFDYYGYEGLAEVICSRLAKALNLRCVKYSPFTRITNDGIIQAITEHGCVSQHFLGEDECEFTLYRLLAYYKDISCLNLFRRPDISVEERMEAVTASIAPLVGKDTWLKTLGTLLLFDAITLNDDRHLNNIIFIYNTVTRSFRLAPLFDNGGALLSCYDARATMDDVRAKPFSTSFQRQLNCYKALYGTDNIPRLSASASIRVDDLIPLYGERLVTRCLTILNQRLSEFDCVLERD